ncbi:uncharacterized protein [Diabrotica undecimpunctata]|uniref:uncharacterized protein n=1 Tax=Diabrotica undecimpunctata TaxID=50387 RepID=UPI003B632C0D
MNTDIKYDKKQWTNDETIELIELYKENSILWRHKRNDHRYRESRDSILKEFSEKFNCSADEIRRKLHNLRNQVSQELRKCSTKKSVNKIDGDFVSRWPYFNALKFLIPILSVKKSEDTLRTKVSLDSTNVVQIQKTSTENANKQNDKYKNEEKHKSYDDDNERLIFKEAMKVLTKQTDEYDKFGQYVAMELKSLRSDLLRNRLKTEIRKAIVRIVEDDDNICNELSGRSFLLTPTPSNSSVPASPSSQHALMTFEENRITCESFSNNFNFIDM